MLVENNFNNQVSNKNSFYQFSIEFGQEFKKVKDSLSCMFAYQLNQPLVGQVRQGNFQCPPKRIVLPNPPTATTTTTTTTTGCTEDQGSTICSEDDAKQVINIGLETQAHTTRKVLEALLSFEEYLVMQGFYRSDQISEIRQFNRGLLAHVLQNKAEYHNLPKESLALAIILLCAEKIQLNKLVVLKFIEEFLKASRVTKISQIRKSRGYSLLACKLRPIPNSLPF
jgi:hypothetical protein